MTNFQNLNLDPLLLKSLEAEGYTEPTPIQAQAIPLVLEGRDLLGIAQTGTGKTAAFALPILHKLNADRRPTPRRGARALILSPTRELANQIGESFRTYGRHLGLKVAVVYGGVGYRPQINALQRGVDILVATPGRLIDHMEGQNVALDATEIFVLDEADQMLDLGFIRPLRQLISKLPSRRQSLFFSATMPHEIGALASELLKDPARVAVTPVAKTADRVTQKVIFVEASKKRSLLVELLGDDAMKRALIFTRTKRGADKVAKHLEDAGISASAIHGNKSQGQREAALAAFKASGIRALVATDIAARGIDVDLVSHVINFELPNVPESYVHRIGRTARAGNEGIAISLCDGEERSYLKEIERLIRQTIPSADRRGDTTLVATAAAPKSEGRPEHTGQRHGRNGGQRPRGAPHRTEGGSEGGHRKKAYGHSNGGPRPSGHGHSEQAPARSEVRGERDFGDRRPSNGTRGEHPRAQNRNRPEKPFREGLNGQEHFGGRGERPNPAHSPRSAHAPRPDREPRSGYAPRPDREPRSGHAPRPDREPRSAHAPRPDREPRSAHAPRPDREPRSAHAPRPDREPRSGHAPRPGHQSQGEAQRGKGDASRKSYGKAPARSHGHSNGQGHHPSKGNRFGNEQRRDRAENSGPKQEGRFRRNSPPS